MNKLISIALFSLLTSLIFLASLFLRSGFSFIENLKPNEGMSFSNFSSNVSSELSRVYEQMWINTMYSGLDKLSGLHRVDENKLLDAVGLQEGMEISPSDYNKLFLYLESYPWIKNFKITKSILPTRIKLNIEETEPAFVVEYSGKSWLMSDHGALIEPLSEISDPKIQVEAINLPRLYDQNGEDSSREVTTLSTTSQKFKTALRTLEYFELAGGLPFEFSTVRILPYGELLFEIKKGAPAREIILCAHNLSEAKSKLLQIEAIIEDLNVRTQVVNRIDLRFEGQGIAN